MRLIDADALMEKIKEPCKDCTQMDCGCFLCDQCEITEEAERVEEAPTVDAVQVVRCKNCRWYDKSDWCNKLRISGVNAVAETWFCAGGERISE